MRTLAIDCATEACSVALFEGEDLLAGDHRILGRGHAEHLVPMVAGLPEKGRADRILVSLGPGSFTGVRIGIATARALGIAWNAEVLGYPTLALVAAMALSETPHPGVTVCMTGGHGEWFVQRFDAGGRAVQPLASLAPEQAAASIATSLVAGSQADAVAAKVSSVEGLAMLPDASRALSLRPDLLSAVVSPIYGRGPDARLPG